MVYNPRKWDIVEMDYQTNVAYVMGFSKEKASDGKKLIFIHSEKGSQRKEWLPVARQRLRFIGR